MSGESADVWIENIPFNETRNYIQRILWHTTVYAWKTQKSWTGSCRRLVVTLHDGTDHVAVFRFR